MIPVGSLEYAVVVNNVASGPGHMVAYGNTVKGEIEPDGDVDVFTFPADVGDVVLINTTGAPHLT